MQLQGPSPAPRESSRSRRRGPPQPQVRGRVTNQPKLLIGRPLWEGLQYQSQQQGEDRLAEDVADDPLVLSQGRSREPLRYSAPPEFARYARQPDNPVRHHEGRREAGHVEVHVLQSPSRGGFVGETNHATRSGQLEVETIRHVRDDPANDGTQLVRGGRDVSHIHGEAPRYVGPEPAGDYKDSRVAAEEAGVTLNESGDVDGRGQDRAIHDDDLR